MSSMVEFVTKLSKLVKVFGVNAKFSTEERKKHFEYLDEEACIGMVHRKFVEQSYQDLVPIKFQKVSDFILINAIIFASEDKKTKTVSDLDVFKKVSVEFLEVTDKFYIPKRSNIKKPYPVFVKILEDFFLLISPLNVDDTDVIQPMYLELLDAESI